MAGLKGIVIRMCFSTPNSNLLIFSYDDLFVNFFTANDQSKIFFL